MGRIINIGGGAMMLAAASQFPEYSQQYVQRLGGAVDELRLVVKDFDTSAQDVGLNREEALASMTGNAFQESRRQDMTRSFTRLDRLETDLAVLKSATPWERLTQVTRLSDGMIAKRAWQDFKPAVPLTLEGLLFALGGFILGFLALFGIGRLFRALFGRKREGSTGQAASTDGRSTQEIRMTRNDPE